MISISELILKEMLDFHFAGFKKLDNQRYDWSEGLELDRYYPELGVAIEFQGIQHLRPTKQFQKDRQEFFRQIDTDTKKRHLCSSKGIQLFSWNLSDITRGRYKSNFKRLAQVGLDYAQKSQDATTVQKLKRINWQREPPETLFRRLAGISRRVEI